MTTTGINAGGQRITNVAPGVAPTDAVNVGQLNASMGNIHNNINRVERKANAGSAAALAAAGLPQAYSPGKSMVALAGSTFQGQAGYALGASKISDNGKWVLKGSVVGSSRGQVGGVVGAGYQW
ncbi:YadA-like family protein [Pelistega indica]|uniref:YadA-like family protein n=1 Tax=Pelistega indica TaxID=1414851 RepID=UPI0003FB76C6|nr:YadA-like family protein [Pelistega indica]